MLLEIAPPNSNRIPGGTPANWGHHSNLLLYLAATEEPDNVYVYRWMSDLLFTTFFVPEAKVQQEASAPNGRYRRVLRKRRATEAKIAAAAAFGLDFESECGLTENQHREKLHARAIELKAADKWIADFVRNDKPRHSSGKLIELFNDFLTRTPILNGQMQSNYLPMLNAMGLPHQHQDQENRLAQEAEDKAEPLRAVFAELQGLSGRKAADELNRRGITTPGGGKWRQAQVVRVRKRLAGRETG